MNSGLSIPRAGAVSSGFDCNVARSVAKVAAIPGLDNFKAFGNAIRMCVPSARPAKAGLRWINPWPERKCAEAVSPSSECVSHTADGASSVPRSSPPTNRTPSRRLERSQSRCHRGIRKTASAVPMNSAVRSVLEIGVFAIDRASRLSCSPSAALSRLRGNKIMGYSCKPVDI